MTLSIWKLLLILIIVFALFGAGKLPRVMGDLGKGIRNLKDGLKSEDDAPPTPKLPPDSPDVNK